MTRDEAIRVAHKYGFVASACDWIGLFTDLGMLKLDEPKNAREKLKDYLTVKGYGPHSADCFISDIDAAGLKIVEK